MFIMSFWLIFLFPEKKSGGYSRHTVCSFVHSHLVSAAYNSERNHVINSKLCMLPAHKERKNPIDFWSCRSRSI